MEDEKNHLLGVGYRFFAGFVHLPASPMKRQIPDGILKRSRS